MKTLHSKEALTQFLQAIDFTGEIWLKASWDFQTSPPTWWATKKNGDPVNYLYTGTVTSTGLSLALCEYAGSDENGNSIWKPTDKHYTDGFAHALDLSHAGATIYFYPNQPQGGISNAHVTGTHLVFYEIDDLPLNQQWEALNQLQERTGLEPAAVVFTGGKSLHVYFRLEKKIDPKHWLRLNRKLAVIQNSDPAICNAARAMRLPGLVRRKLIDGKLSEPAQITLEQWRNATYSPEDFEVALDSTGLFPHNLSNERWRQWQKAKREKEETSAILQKSESDLIPKSQYNKPIEHEFAYDGSTIPLKVCLSKDDRALIAAGAGEGNRDNAGYKLARNLIGTANQLLTLGIHFTCDPRQLFEEYCSQCTPPLPSRDIERIWRSASRGTPSASLPDESLKACIGAYQCRQNQPTHKPKSATVSRQQWLEQFGLDQQRGYLGKQLSSFLRKITRKTQKFWNAYNSKRCNEQPILPATEKTSNAIVLAPWAKYLRLVAGKLRLTYEPGHLPTPKEWVILGRPKITYSNGERLNVWAEAQKKGWGSVYDRSLTGFGKSHDAGNISLGKFDSQFNRVFYLSADAENPTTASVEREFTRLVPRHNGQVYDHSHHTALGNPYIRRAKGETPDIPSNCPETETFHLLSQGKGFVAHGGKNSAICESCPLFANCEFLNTRSQQLENENFLRAHPDQMPTPKNTDIGIIDEASKTLSINKTVTFSWEEMLASCRAIYQQNPSLYELIYPIVIDWADKINRAEINPRFGLPHVDAIKLLAKDLYQVDTDWLNAPDVWATPSLWELATQCDEVLQGNLHEILSGHLSPAQKQTQISEKFFVKWFSQIVNILTGKDRYAHITFYADGRVAISRRYNRHRHVIQGFGFKVFLDATMSKSDLCLRVNLDPDTILEVEQEIAEKAFSNLTINLINDIGACSQQRDTHNTQNEKVSSIYAEQNRIAAAVDSIKAKHPGQKVGILDFKNKVHNYSADVIGHWFVDNRGSNAFADCDVIVAIGKPLANLNALAQQYQALTGISTHPTHFGGKFGAWVNRQVASEDLQLVGRARAHLTPDCPKTVYLLGRRGGQMPTLLQEFFPGATVNIVDAYDITPAAAKKGVQTARAIAEVMWASFKDGITPTCETVASQLGITRQAVSKAAKSIVPGGFSALKRCQLFLIEVIEGKVDKQELDEETLAIAQILMSAMIADLDAGDSSPDEVAQDLVSLLEGYGGKVFRAILAEVPAYILPKLLAVTVDALGLTPYIDIDIGRCWVPA
ncbi:primase C-terminal domain-containing protein [Leptolyngbya sp. FACHB-671]|uniref:primase C-terminal domain-containing protein n=1 Tax=Leptolyngbya sp. FACHB-671 TaxID=2692812 RepID=UPI001685435F|nr:primase C-terminal domain-containing protein [Leptolyngbya sp. FACHB-671]MBD2066265.1 primase C-terminal domain-containing protein [Leptolyngbya sp. FACHB-671]